MRSCFAALACALALTACDQGGDVKTRPSSSEGRAIQGFQATFYEMADAEDRWVEVAISVDGDKTFRMPVFFTENGSLVSISESETRQLIDRWLKHRAASVAAFGSIDAKIGTDTPFLAIDRNRP